MSRRGTNRFRIINVDKRFHHLSTGSLSVNNISMCPVVIGEGAVGGIDSTAVGCNAFAGFSGIALGSLSKAKGDTEIALGNNAETDGAGGIALGNNAKTVGAGGMALGVSANVLGNYSIALGFGSLADENNLLAIASSGFPLTTVANTDSLQTNYLKVKLNGNIVFVPFTTTVPLPPP